MRMGPWPVASAVLLLLVTSGAAPAAERFGQATAYLERNVTDDDVEIRFEVTGTREGLATLRVTAPDGRTVVDFRAPDSRLGIYHLDLESPEPGNDGSPQADFPAGQYRFAATTPSGTELQGTATLSHAFPPTASFVSPRPDQRGVPVVGQQVRWSPVAGVDGYVVVIEQEKTGQEVRALLPDNVTAFAIPNGLLAPGTEYKLAIGTIGPEGNRSFVETSFTTAEGK